MIFNSKKTYPISSRNHPSPTLDHQPPPPAGKHRAPSPKKFHVHPARTSLDLFPRNISDSRRNPEPRRPQGEAEGATEESAARKTPATPGEERLAGAGGPRRNFNFLRVRESLSSRDAVLATWPGGDADETEKFPPASRVHTYKRVYIRVARVQRPQRGRQGWTWN